MTQYINSASLEENIEPKFIPNTAHIEDGKRFHLLMQQIGLGISVDNLLAEYPYLRKWVNTAKQYTQIPGSKQWNENLSQQFNGLYLIENYDFIVTNDDKIIAVDWTISKPQNFEDLQNSWKTQLRLFLLHEAKNIPCENISLVYVFANCETIYQCCYSDKQHQENKQKLELIIPAQSAEKDNSPLKVHKDWLAGNISTQEYIEAIPEVEI